MTFIRLLMNSIFMWNYQKNNKEDPYLLACINIWLMIALYYPRRLTVSLNELLFFTLQGEPQYLSDINEMYPDDS